MTIPNFSPISMPYYWLVANKALFFNPNGEIDQSFNFSSTIEKVGVEWDCVLKNNSIVIVVSESVEIDNPKYGKIWLTKVKANMAPDFHTIIGEFWVPTITLVDIEDEG